MRRAFVRLQGALTELCTQLIHSPATSNHAVVEVQLAVTAIYKIFDSVRRRQALAQLVALAEEKVAQKRALLARLQAATAAAEP